MTFYDLTSEEAAAITIAASLTGTGSAVTSEVSDEPEKATKAEKSAETLRQQEAVDLAPAPGKEQGTATEPPPPVHPLTPAVLALAQELMPGLDYSLIPGTGKEGRVTQGDVKAYAKKMGPGAATSHAAEPVASADTSASAPDLVAASSALSALVESKGVPAARELFAKFNVARLGEMDAAKYAEFIKACEATISGIPF